jgi:diaminopimelate epimerase
MTTISLTKHHGLGNDFLVTFDLPVEEGAEAAREWCDRRRGVGADGLLVGIEAPGQPVRMVLFNADGSRAEMSGNGIRCFAQAVADRRGSAPGEYSIETDAGTRTVTVRPTSEPDTVEATVDMGEVTSIAEPDGWESLGCHPDRPVAHLSLGNPHTVVGVDDVDEVDLLSLGRRVPQINLEIIAPGPGPSDITMRVHERGAGITAACGTGACAAAYASRYWGLVAATSDVTVHMVGGTATVSFDGERSAVAHLTGPATRVAAITMPPRAERPVETSS